MEYHIRRCGDQYIVVKPSPNGGTTKRAFPTMAEACDWADALTVEQLSRAAQCAGMVGGGTEND